MDKKTKKILVILGIIALIYFLFLRGNIPTDTQAVFTRPIFTATENTCKLDWDSGDCKGTCPTGKTCGANQWGICGCV